jgi:hypothetical protein
MTLPGWQTVIEEVIYCITPHILESYTQVLLQRGLLYETKLLSLKSRRSHKSGSLGTPYHSVWVGSHGRGRVRHGLP